MTDIPPAEFDTPAEAALQAIPDPSQVGSGWRIVQITPAPLGWYGTYAPPSGVPIPAVQRPVAAWVLLQHYDGRQVVRGYIADIIGSGALVDGEAEAITLGREWFGYGLDDPAASDEA